MRLQESGTELLGDPRCSQRVGLFYAPHGMKKQPGEHADVEQMLTQGPETPPPAKIKAGVAAYSCSLLREASRYHFRR